MRLFIDQTFDGFDDRDSGAVFSDLEFRRCHFEGCTLSLTSKPSLRSTVRNVRLIECSETGMTLRSAIVEDVVVDDFKTHGQPFFIDGAVFKHVVLRGRIEDIVISPLIGSSREWERPQPAFDKANAEYYRHVDWALDISQAEFKAFTFRGGIPVHLIRRDPETQVIVTRQKAIDGKWRELAYQDGLCKTSLDLFLKREDPATILVAPKRHRKFPNYLADLQLLREAGVAEPD